MLTRLRALASPILLAVACCCACSSARADIHLDTTLGFDNTFRPDSWTPAIVRLTGAGVNATGTLQVIVSSREGASSYSRPVRLHSGPLNEQHTVLYYHTGSMPQPTILVQLIVDGRKVAEQKVDKAFSLRDFEPAIVALTQDRSGLNYLLRQDLGRQHLTLGSRQYNQYISGQQNLNPGVSNGSNLVRVLYPPASGLPDGPGGYSAVDAVMLGDLPLDAMTEDQWSALAQWVQDGGELIVSGGGDLNRLRNPQLAEMLPIVPSGPVQVRGYPALAERYSTPMRPVPSTAMASQLKPDAVIVCQQGDVPLISFRRSGLGVVVFTAFDLTAPELRAWPGQPAVWTELLHQGIGDLRATDVFKASSQYPWYTSFRSLSDALAGVQSTQAPSFTFIGIFLLAYIVCLVPVNYFLLRKWDKKELAWITAPVIIVAFSTGAYAIGYSVKGGALFLRYATVLEGSAGGDEFAANTLASIFSPRQTRYDVSVPDSAALASEVSQETNQFGRLGGDISVESDRKTMVKEALVNMWDHRNFAFDSHVKLKGFVAASAVPVAGGVKVQVTNDLPYALEDCSVAYRDRSAAIGHLESHQSATVTLPPGQAGNGRIGPLNVTTRSNRAQGASEPIRTAMASAISQNEAAVQGRDPLLFTGWIDQSVDGLALEGEKPIIEGATLLAVHIAPPGVRAAATPPRVRKPNFRADPFASLPGMNMTRTPPPIDPRSRADSLNNQAYTLANQGDLDGALKAAQKALQLMPNDGNILDTVADMYLKRKEYDKAAKLFAQALQRQAGGGIPETHEKYGETLLALGRREEAVKQLNQAASDTGTWGQKAQKKLREIGK